MGYGATLRFISRQQWLAQPPESELTNLELPSMRVIVAHTATENCSTQVTQAVIIDFLHFRLGIKKNNNNFYYNENFHRQHVHFTYDSFKHFTWNHGNGMILPIIF